MARRTGTRCATDWAESPCGSLPHAKCDHRVARPSPTNAGACNSKEASVDTSSQRPDAMQLIRRSIGDGIRAEVQRQLTDALNLRLDRQAATEETVLQRIGELRPPNRTPGGRAAMSAKLPADYPASADHSDRQRWILEYEQKFSGTITDEQIDALEL